MVEAAAATTTTNAIRSKNYDFFLVRFFPSEKGTHSSGGDREMGGPGPRMCLCVCWELQLTEKY